MRLDRVINTRACRCFALSVITLPVWQASQLADSIRKNNVTHECVHLRITVIT